MLDARAAGEAGESAIQQLLIAMRSQETSRLVRCCFEDRLTSADRAPWALGLLDGTDGRFPGKAARIPGAERWGRAWGELGPMCTASLWSPGEGQSVVLWLWARTIPSPLFWEVGGGCTLACTILLEPVGALWPCRDGGPAVDLSLVELDVLGPVIRHLLKSKSHIPGFLQTGALTGTDFTRI